MDDSLDGQGRAKSYLTIDCRKVGSPNAVTARTSVTDLGVGANGPFPVSTVCRGLALGGGDRVDVFATLDAVKFLGTPRLPQKLLLPTLAWPSNAVTLWHRPGTLISAGNRMPVVGGLQVTALRSGGDQPCTASFALGLRKLSTDAVSQAVSTTGHCAEPPPASSPASTGLPVVGWHMGDLSGDEAETIRVSSRTRLGPVILGKDIGEKCGTETETAGKPCRRGDHAYAEVPASPWPQDNNLVFDNDGIFRPQTENRAGSDQADTSTDLVLDHFALSPGGVFTIKGARPPRNGEIVHKVGRTTGWTSGEVSDPELNPDPTCPGNVIGNRFDNARSRTESDEEDENDDHVRYYLECLTHTSYESDGGDSGAPVFSMEGGSSLVTLVGVHFAGLPNVGKAGGAFIPIDRVYADALSQGYDWEPAVLRPIPVPVEIDTVDAAGSLDGKPARVIEAYFDIQDVSPLLYYEASVFRWQMVGTGPEAWVELTDLGCSFSRADRSGRLDYPDRNDCAGVREMEDDDRLIVSFDTIYPSPGDQYTVRLRACMEPAESETGNCGGFGPDGGQIALVKAASVLQLIGASRFEFQVLPSAARGTVVGRLITRTPEEGSLKCRISEGNGDGYFAIDASTCAITIAEEPEPGSYQLIVTASIVVVGESNSALRSTPPAADAGEEEGQVDRATVLITVAEPCSNGISVPGPDSNAGLVGDCEVLLEARDALAGTGTLDWNGQTPVSDWEGVTVSGTPERVTGLDLRSKGLNGGIPGKLGDLTELATLRLSGNRLTGCIAPGLKDIATNDLATLGLEDCAADPEVQISGLEESIVEDLDDYLTISVSNLDWESSYRIRVSTDNGNLGIDHGCSNDGHDIAVPAGSTSYRTSVRLLACGTPGGTVTVALLSGEDTVATATRDVTVTGAPSGQRVLIRNLVDSLAPGQNHRFQVRVENLSALKVYRVRLSTEGGIRFGTSCSSSSREIHVPSGFRSFERTIRLNGCTAPGGAVKAVLVSDGMTRGKATREVVVAEPSERSIVITGLASELEEEDSDRFTVDASDLDSQSSYTIRVSTDSIDIGFDDSCGDRQVDVTVSPGSTSHRTALTLYGCDGAVGEVTAKLLSGGTAEATDSQNVTVVRVNAEAGGLPTIGGSLQVGRRLTVDTSRITDADGLTDVSYSYQWVRVDGGTDSDIAGATGSTYRLVPADEGKAVRVRVSFADDEGNDEELTSAVTEVVAARPNTEAGGVLVMSGTLQVGETLRAIAAWITDADGLSNVAFSYQWVRVDGETDSDIAGATGSAYRLVSADTARGSGCA